MFRSWGGCVYLALFPGRVRYTVFIVRVDDKFFESCVCFLFSRCLCLALDEFDESGKACVIAVDVFPDKFFRVSGRSSVATSSANKDLAPVF